MTMTAKEFKDAREIFKLSQTAMGRKMGGYKLRTVQSWEAGERAIPQAVELIVRTHLEQKSTITLHIVPQAEGGYCWEIKKNGKETGIRSGKTAGWTKEYAIQHGVGYASPSNLEFHVVVEENK